MDTTHRPHRHLCPDADERDAMTDDEFWAHVLPTLTEPDDDGPDLDAAIAGTPCEECGATGACAYDADGRPLIHATHQDGDA